MEPISAANRSSSNTILVHDDVWMGCGRFRQGEWVGGGEIIIVLKISLAEMHESNNYLAVAAAVVGTYFCKE